MFDLAYFEEIIAHLCHLYKKTIKE